jgi:hypothetical protein
MAVLHLWFLVNCNIYDIMQYTACRKLRAPPQEEDRKVVMLARLWKYFMSFRGRKQRRLEQDRLDIMGVPTQADMFRPADPARDPMSFDADTVPPLPDTNEKILCGGLDGGVYSR